MYYSPLCVLRCSFLVWELINSQKEVNLFMLNKTNFVMTVCIDLVSLFVLKSLSNNFRPARCPLFLLMSVSYCLFEH